jgi:hypothetical protein
MLSVLVSLLFFLALSLLWVVSGTFNKLPESPVLRLLDEVFTTVASPASVFVLSIACWSIYYFSYTRLSSSDELEVEIRQKGRQAISEVEAVAQNFMTSLTDNRLRDLISEQITEQALGELVATTDRVVWDKYLDRRIEREIDALRDNLTEWLVSAGRSARINYLAALLFAGGGIFVAMTFFFPQFNQSDLRVGADGQPDLARDILFVLLPRALLVVAMELVAIHFFRLHQAGQASTRYIRDEINTLRFKTTAFYAALKVGSKAFQNEVITNFLAVERQRILAANETTIGLERERLNQEGLTQAMEEFARQLGVASELLASANSAGKKTGSKD